jgi:hypothetical protein
MAKDRITRTRLHAAFSCCILHDVINAGGGDQQILLTILGHT